MKFCPYCGATLLGGAASFCAECGKPVPNAAQPLSDTEDAVDTQKPELPVSKQHKKATESHRSKKKGKVSTRSNAPEKEKRTKTHQSVTEAKANTGEDGYDGYYDDVRPMDNGHERERMDPELIKRIALVGGGAVLIIGLAIGIMLLL